MQLRPLAPLELDLHLAAVIRTALDHLNACDDENREADLAMFCSKMQKGTSPSIHHGGPPVSALFLNLLERLDVPKP